MRTCANHELLIVHVSPGALASLKFPKFVDLLARGL